MTSALQRGLAVCHVCLATTPVERHACGRCGARVHGRIPNSVQRTIALCCGAALLYLPANLLPIMVTDQFGRVTESTIIGGVLRLLEMGSYPVALVILVASVLIPLGKLAALGLLCWAVTHSRVSSPAQRTTLYRITELVGKWSMVDVFVVAVLVALIQMGGIMQVKPGAAALAFAGVVIVTMLAAENFDPRLIWDREYRDDD
ncbi:MAG: paraquat-inducible protein A [Pseudomonadales bacterium]